MEFNNSEFLIWCKKNKILMKRMAILVSFSEDLLELHIALDSYLKEFGSSVVAVSFKFNYNCGFAPALIILAFEHCPNLILFSLDGGLLHIREDRCWKILQIARSCHSLRDWIFVGRNPLTTGRDTDAYVYYFENLQHLIIRRDVEIREVFVSRKQKTLQVCQYTLEILEEVKTKKQFRVTFIDSDMTSLSHHWFLSMISYYTCFLIPSLRLILAFYIIIDNLVRVLPRGSKKLSFDWIKDDGRSFMYPFRMEDIDNLSIWGVRDTDLKRDGMLIFDLRTFFDGHEGNSVRLEIHMTDHSCHEELFAFVKDILEIPNAHLSSLDISIESENSGVMTLCPPATRYMPKLRIYDQLIEMTQNLYPLLDTIGKVRSTFNFYGMLSRQLMLENHPEFEEIHTLYNIQHGPEYGILYELEVHNRTRRFRHLIAGGFEYEFRHHDMWRLQRVSFGVYF